MSETPSNDFPTAEQLPLSSYADILRALAILPAAYPPEPGVFGCKLSGRGATVLSDYLARVRDWAWRQRQGGYTVIPWNCDPLCAQLTWNVAGPVENVLDSRGQPLRRVLLQPGPGVPFEIAADLTYGLNQAREARQKAEAEKKA